MLAQAEFNRYYCRAVCRAAIDRDGEDAVLQVYREKEVGTPRPGSERLEGTTIPAADLLADLRANSPGERSGCQVGSGRG